MGLPFLPPVKPPFKLKDIGKEFADYAVLEPSLSPLTMWQDAEGSTPVTATGQVVGLLWDQSKPIPTLGPELVTNGTFQSDIAGWTSTGPNITSTWSSGNARLQITTGTNQFSRGVSVEAGKAYRVTGDVTLVSGTLLGSLSVRTTNNVGTSAFLAGKVLSGGENSFVYTAATTTTVYVGLYIYTQSQTVDVDNISIRAVLSNNATQATTANKPTYQTDARGVPVLRHDTTDVLTMSAATSFGSAASVYYATATAVTQTHGVNVGTSYALPGKPGSSTADVYGWIVTPSRPSSNLEANIVKYLSRKAGL